MIQSVRYAEVRSDVTDISYAIKLGLLQRVWELVKEGHQIPGLANGDSNLRSIIENCPDPALIQSVLANMSIREINHVPSTSGYTALRQAVSCRNVLAVSLLIQAKADVKVTDVIGNTVLHGTTFFSIINLPTPQSCTKKRHIQNIFQRSVESARLLLDHGASIDAANVFGDTPLRGCIGENWIKRKNIGLITLLVSEGARLPSPSDVTKASPTGRVNRAIQKGLQIRREVVRQGVASYLIPSLTTLVAEYV